LGKMRSPEQWKRYAKALDMHLAGHTLREVVSDAPGLSSPPHGSYFDAGGAMYV